MGPGEAELPGTRPGSSEVTNGPEFKVLETETWEDAHMQDWETLPFAVVGWWDSSWGLD